MLERLVILLYPIIPQITSVIADELKINLDSIQFPKVSMPKHDSEPIIRKIMEFNSAVWKAKKDKSISLKEKISGIVLPAELADFSADLKACHNLS